MLHDPVGSLLKLLMLSVDTWFFEKCTSVHLVEDANSWIRFCIPARSFKVCSVLYIGCSLNWAFQRGAPQGLGPDEVRTGWIWPVGNQLAVTARGCHEALEEKAKSEENNTTIIDCTVILKA
jgi:hypothetical protein